MNSIKPAEMGDLLSCDICFMEIPVSEAKSEEATEYVVYFCGLDCYEKNNLRAKKITDLLERAEDGLSACSGKNRGYL